jgi:RNA polymerase sigma factor (TIGR02999 family)
MGHQKPEDLTVLLQAWHNGSQQAGDRLIAAVNHELKAIAARYLRRERAGHTLEPAALVNEAYMRLVKQRRLDWQSRGHFFAVASREMRRILVDYARQRCAAKRGAIGDERISLSEVPNPENPLDVELLALHEALDGLAATDQRQAEVLELRYFGGLSIEETAESMGISPATVKREVVTAMRWLRLRLDI